MRIDNNQLNLAGAIGKPQADVHSSKSASRQFTSPEGDKVGLSSFARLVSGDPAKTDRLAAAVASGTYRVDSHAVANAMIGDLLAA